jgi:UDP-N-acetylglucosamine 1-carboxyvinyltransferase
VQTFGGPESITGQLRLRMMGCFKQQSLRWCGKILVVSLVIYFSDSVQALQSKESKKLLTSSDNTMDDIEGVVVRGGNKLFGKIMISGSKHAALTILAASILCTKPVILSNIPDISDVSNMIKILKKLGIKVEVYGRSTVHEGSKNRKITLDASNIIQSPIFGPESRSMRSSILVLGPLLSRLGHAQVSFPGGCALGKRSIDLHIHSLELMGATFVACDENVLALTDKNRLHGSEIHFEKVSVGATSNVIMAASIAIGETIIHNSACEPEIVDLCNFLNVMGANITGIGTKTISIAGVDSLAGGRYEIIGDRIEAGTYAIAAALTNGELMMEGINTGLLTAIIVLLKSIGVAVREYDDGLGLSVTGDVTSKYKPVDVETMPYPGLATDFHPQIVALLCLINGLSHMKETIFEDRYMYVPELKRMGADVNVNQDLVTSKGIDTLLSAKVVGTDLRAFAALVLAALSAVGESTILGAHHIKRGYELFVEKLQACGAELQYVRLTQHQLAGAKQTVAHLELDISSGLKRDNFNAVVNNNLKTDEIPIVSRFPSQHPVAHPSISENQKSKEIFKKGEHICLHRNMTRIESNSVDRAYTLPVCSKNKHVHGQWFLSDPLQLQEKHRKIPCCSWDDNNNRGTAHSHYCKGFVQRNNSFSGKQAGLTYNSGRACSCRQFSMDKYSYFPSHCSLPKWNASEFCIVLGKKKILMIGDSIMKQTTSVLINSIAIAISDENSKGCHEQITFAPADTLIGENFGRSNRGDHWLHHARKQQPDILVLSVGPHIHKDAGTNAFQSVLRQVIAEHAKEFSSTPLVWRGQFAAGCITNSPLEWPADPSMVAELWENYSKRHQIYNYDLFELWDRIAERELRGQNHFFMDFSPLFQRPDAHVGSEQHLPYDCLHW